MNKAVVNGMQITSSLDAEELAFIGDMSLDTTADTLSGAINEHESDISELNSNLTKVINTSVSGLTCQKIAGIVSLTLSSISMDTDGKTLAQVIPSGFRPAYDASYYSKVYDGSNYVDCRVAISTNGTIQIINLFSGAISGIRPTYVTNRNFVYFV